jgi:TPR repeat protein
MKDVENIPSSIKAQLAFTCAHEKDRIPPRDPEAEQLYKHARWLVKGNTLQPKPEVYPKIERLVRIAAAHGHDKANIELQRMLSSGQAASAGRRQEVIDLTEALIARGIPSGHYSMGWYLERGYGVEQDEELALKYYRKSADLGSPEGQFLVGTKLNSEIKHGKEIAAIGLAMWRCAADQGHAEAAERTGIDDRIEGHLAEAARYFQIAAANGNSGGAFKLANAFGPRSTQFSEMNFGFALDAERERRYRAIWDFLDRHEHFYAKALEIGRIVPLPPAPLPEWDGTFEWLKAHEANIPPPLPSEERIAEMARAKGLDPQTGRSAAK